MSHDLSRRENVVVDRRMTIGYQSNRVPQSQCTTRRRVDAEVALQAADIQMLYIQLIKGFSKIRIVEESAAVFQI